MNQYLGLLQYIIQYVKFSTKITRHAKEQENMTHIQGGKNQTTETAFERAQMSDLTKTSKQLL